MHVVDVAELTHFLQMNEIFLKVSKSVYFHLIKTHLFPQRVTKEIHHSPSVVLQLLPKIPCNHYPDPGQCVELLSVWEERNLSSTWAVGEMVTFEEYHRDWPFPVSTDSPLTLWGPQIKYKYSRNSTNRG